MARAGRVVAIGETGELCVKGGQVIRGYLNRPEATAAWDDIEGTVRGGQEAFKALKHAPFPVIGAPSGMALGGSSSFTSKRMICVWATVPFGFVLCVVANRYT